MTEYRYYLTRGVIWTTIGALVPFLMFSFLLWGLHDALQGSLPLSYVVRRGPFILFAVAATAWGWVNGWVLIEGWQQVGNFLLFPLLVQTLVGVGGAWLVARSIYRPVPEIVHLILGSCAVLLFLSTVSRVHWETV